MYQSSGDLPRADGELRDAMRFALWVAVAGAALLVFAALWRSTCHDATADSLACGAPQLTLLGLAGPAVLLAGALRSLVRAVAARRRSAPAGAWQAAGWSLAVLTLLAVAAGMPAGAAMFSA